MIYALLLGVCLYQLTHQYQVAGPNHWLLPELPEHSMWIAFMMANGWEAYQALTQIGKLYVGNMVDTYYSLVAKIDKKYALIQDK